MLEIHRHMHHYQAADRWGAIVSLVDRNGLYRLGEVMTETSNFREAQALIDATLQDFLDEGDSEFISWCGLPETLQ